MEDHNAVVRRIADKELLLEEEISGVLELVTRGAFAAKAPQQLPASTFENYQAMVVSVTGNHLIAMHNNAVGTRSPLYWRRKCPVERSKAWMR